MCHEDIKPQGEVFVNRYLAKRLNIATNRRSGVTLLSRPQTRPRGVIRNLTHKRALLTYGSEVETKPFELAIASLH